MRERMEVKVDSLSKQITKNNPDLITRPVGRRMYKKLIDKMDIIQEGEVVILDFEKIKVIDSSFIDEFIVKLLSDSVKTEQFYLKLRKISDIAEINISSVIKSYAQVDKKIVVMTEDICLNNNFYIGELSSSEHDAINFIRINQRVSLEDLIAGTGMSEESAEKTLESLVDLRLVRVQDKYIYCAV